MSLYNKVCKINPAARALIELIGIEYESIPRFRDMYFKEPNQVVIFTRTGGCNRESYVEENQKLSDYIGYVIDFDDSFDSTYAHWIYEISEEKIKDFLEPLKSKEITDEQRSDIIKIITKLPTDKFKSVIKTMKEIE